MSLQDSKAHLGVSLDEVLETAHLVSVKRITTHAQVERSDDVVTARIGVTIPNPEDPKETTIRALIRDKIKAQNNRLSVKSELKKLSQALSLYVRDADGTIIQEVPISAMLTFYWWEKD